MKNTVLIGAILAGWLGAGQVMGQCPSPGRLSKGAIESALVGKWACAKDGADMWNEQAVGGGTLKECHSGLTTGPDPIDDNKGSWVTTGNPPPASNPGTIIYNYPPSGGSYEYNVYEVAAGSTYTFCRVNPSDAKTYTVHITSCPPPNLNSCP
jgi:hypothetical protein